MPEVKLKKAPLKTDEVISRLAVRYSAPAYAFLTQVRRGTGYATAIRTADALAMSLYPSRGLHLSGIEVKVSRTDWLKELADPSKADEIAQFCDFWYVAVGDINIIQLGELPPTWGLIAPKGSGMTVVKEATKLKTKPFDNSFIAAIMRNMTDNMVSRDSIKQRVDDARKSGAESSNIYLKREEEKVKEMTDRIVAFEKASGVRLDNWSVEHNKDIGVAVRAVLDGKDKKVHERLVELRKRAAGILKYIDGEHVNDWDM